MCEFLITAATLPAKACFDLNSIGVIGGKLFCLNFFFTNARRITYAMRMWIVILNFCLFLLLLGFFFYGIRQWTSLISEPEEDSKNVIIDGRNLRLPLWILIAGLGAVSLLKDILSWLGY